LGNFDARSSATVRQTKSWQDLGNSLAFGLQHGVNSISLQCIPWHVGCSEWGACLTPSKFGVLWANDPRMETFHKFMSKICVSTTIHVSRPNIVKIGHCEVAEKSSRIAYKKNPESWTRPSPPFRPHFADHAQKFTKVVRLSCCVYVSIWSGSAAVCRTYSGKSPKKSACNYNFIVSVH